MSLTTATRRLGSRVDEDDRPSSGAASGDATPGVSIVSPSRLRPDRWYFVGASIDVDGGRTGLAAAAPPRPGAPLRRSSRRGPRRSISWSIPHMAFVAASATDGRCPSGISMAKSIRPASSAAACPTASLRRWLLELSPHSLGGLAAAWRFDPVHDSNTGTVHDSGPMRAHAELVNMPMLGVTGRNWTGAHLDFSQAPDEYRAAYFHADDLVDCAWEADFAFRRLSRPAKRRLWCRAGRPAKRRDVVPFIVSAGVSRRPVAPLAVLLPTFSYLAYANEHASWQNPIGSTGDLERLAAAVGPADRFMAEEELNSIYDRHRDGTGSACRPGCGPCSISVTTTPCPWSAGPHQLSADMELLRWLDAEEIPYDVITDDDLHRSGLRALTQVPGRRHRDPP